MAEMVYRAWRIYAATAGRSGDRTPTAPLRDAFGRARIFLDPAHSGTSARLPGLTQAKLASRANVSTSLLKAVEQPNSSTSAAPGAPPPAPNAATRSPAPTVAAKCPAAAAPRRGAPR